MSKEKNKKVKEERKVIELGDLKLIKIFCFVVGFILLVLFVLALFLEEFIPATLIALSLELFSVSYYFYEKQSSRKIIYSIFIVGVIILAISVIYTLANII